MKDIKFVNKLVKQGNSLCVRVPSSIVKDGRLNEGMEVLMSIVPKEVNYEYGTKLINNLLKTSNKVKKLNKYNEMEKRLFIVLNFEFLKFSRGKNLEKRGREFYDVLTSLFDKKFADKFIDFETTFNEEAFISEEDGTTILKPEYR